MLPRYLVALALTCALPCAALAAEGEDLFKARCAACHTPEKAAAKARKLPEADRAEHLDRFIVKHAPLDDAQRKTVVDYLLTVGD